MGRKQSKAQSGHDYLAEFFGADCVADIREQLRAVYRVDNGTEIGDGELNNRVEEVALVQQAWDKLASRACRNREVEEVETNTGYVNVVRFAAVDLLGMMREMVERLPEANRYHARFSALYAAMRALLTCKGGTR